jgi:PAS domain S-box-containing protein
MKISASDILNASILIVDDQKSNVILLEEMLQDAGYTSIQSTIDPREVFRLHLKNNFDLILLDLQMPYMDGFQVMEGLQELETEAYLSVLVITAQPDHKLRALQSGAKDFISKPFDIVEVKTRISNMLEVRLLYKKIKNYNNELEQTVLERTAELRESEERFRHLTELSSDWYWEQDENRNFTKIYGPVLEMLGVKVEDMGDSGEGQWRWNEAELKALEENLEARRPFLDFVFTRTSADGAPEYLMVSGEPMFDHSGRFTGYRGIGKNVTEALLPN